MSILRHKAMVRHYGETVFVQMVRDDDGSWVEYSAHAEITGKMTAAVDAEMKRLGLAIVKVTQADSEMWTQSAELSESQGEVERLTQLLSAVVDERDAARRLVVRLCLAGDAMHDYLHGLAYDARPPDDDWEAIVLAWETARKK